LRIKKLIAAAIALCLLAVFCPVAPALGQDSPALGADSASVTTVGNDGEKGAGYLPYEDPAAVRPGGFFGAVLRTIFSLAVVLGLLYLTLWAIKKFTGGAAGPFAGGAVRVVGRVYLSPKSVVYFLRLPDELLVIGTNAGGIAPLTTITDEETISLIEKDLGGLHGGASGPTFSRLFDGSMAKFQKPPEAGEAGFDDQLRTLNDKIGRLKGMARRRKSDEE
jgi:flagellar biogenesis protein FliO